MRFQKPELTSTREKGTNV